MVELNNTFRLARIVVFATTSLFALIVLILSGLVTNFSGGLYVFGGLGIATALFTLLSLPAMLALSRVRKGAFSSMIALEIGWTWFLWIMWLAVGGDSANVLAFVGSCSRFEVFGPSVEAACSESMAIAAFGFICWAMLLGYFITLTTLTFKQHMRGNTGIWTKDVTETDFTAVGSNNNTQMLYDNKAIYPNQYPPVGTPQQSPGPYPQGGVPYQAGSPQQSPHHQPPQALYTQPQGATGSYTHPQAQTGASPYPQV